MSDPEINERAEAAIERIQHLTEKMLAAAGTAGAGVLEAHRKALQGLAEFTNRPALGSNGYRHWPRCTRSSSGRPARPTSPRPARPGRRCRRRLPTRPGSSRSEDLNKRILTRARDAGSNALHGYETALRGMAEFETKIAGAAQPDWVKALAASHAAFLTDVGTLYANALHVPLSNKSVSEP